MWWPQQSQKYAKVQKLNRFMWARARSFQRRRCAYFGESPPKLLAAWIEKHSTYCCVSCDILRAQASPFRYRLSSFSQIILIFPHCVRLLFAFLLSPCHRQLCPGEYFYAFLLFPFLFSRRLSLFAKLFAKRHCVEYVYQRILAGIHTANNKFYGRSNAGCEKKATQ